jgi:hypothetical protein
MSRHRLTCASVCEVTGAVKNSSPNNTIASQPFQDQGLRRTGRTMRSERRAGRSRNQDQLEHRLVRAPTRLVLIAATGASILLLAACGGAAGAASTGATAPASASGHTGRSAFHSI